MITKNNKGVTICTECQKWIKYDDKWGWYLPDGPLSYDGLAYHDHCRPKEKSHER